MIIERLIQLEIWNYETATMLLLIDMEMLKIEDTIENLGRNIVVDENYMFCCQYNINKDIISILWNYNDFSIKYSKKSMKNFNVLYLHINYIELFKKDYVLGISDDDFIFIFDWETGSLLQFIKTKTVSCYYNYARARSIFCILNYDTLLILTDAVKMYLL